LKNDSCSDHHHLPNRFGVVPTAVRLNADTNYTGKGVTMAFLDSGFYPHPDLVEPENRILAYHDVTDETSSLKPEGYGSVARLLTTAGGIDRSRVESWQWHGTQTSVVAAGNGRLSDGLYRGLASAAQVVLIKASERGRISEENIARGIEWVIDNRDRHYIRVSKPSFVRVITASRWQVFSLSDCAKSTQ
jgi:serine protease AprX